MSEPQQQRTKLSEEHAKITCRHGKEIQERGNSDPDPEFRKEISHLGELVREHGEKSLAHSRIAQEYAKSPEYSTEATTEQVKAAAEHVQANVAHLEEIAKQLEKAQEFLQDSQESLKESKKRSPIPEQE